MRTHQTFKLLILAQIALIAVLCGGCEEISIDKNSVDFDFQPTSSIKAGDTIFFNNTSTGHFNCLWDFGDGMESQELNPTHVYEAKGLYTVTLKVLYNGPNKHVDTVVISKPLNVSLQPPKSSFTHKRIAEQTIAFSNTSTSSTQCLWSFGDGSTSTEVSPTHTFSTFGEQTVTLTTFNDGCQDSIVKVIELSTLIDLKEAHLDGLLSKNMVLDVDFDGVGDFIVYSGRWSSPNSALDIKWINISCKNDYQLFSDTVMNLGVTDGTPHMFTLATAKIHLLGDTIKINNVAQGGNTDLTEYNSQRGYFRGIDEWINSNEIRYIGFRKCSNGINKLGWIKVKVIDYNKNCLSLLVK